MIIPSKILIGLAAIATISGGAAYSITPVREAILGKPQQEQINILADEIEKLKQQLEKKDLELESIKQKETQKTEKSAITKIFQIESKSASVRLNPAPIIESKPIAIEIKPEPVITESYEYHDYYPIIISLSDNKGNIVKSSRYNRYNGVGFQKWEQQTLKIGDKIYLKIEAKDPQNRQILYNWNSNSQYFNQLIGIKNGRYEWTTNNELQYTITAEDLKTTGEIIRIVVNIKSEKDYLRFPGGSHDDSLYVDYILTP